MVAGSIPREGAATLSRCYTDTRHTPDAEAECLHSARGLPGTHTAQTLRKRPVKAELFYRRVLYCPRVDSVKDYEAPGVKDL
ncbi:hypothetical protein NDU88_003382 [Pleurodeles waltl]|uniref:Uncharacterized protein n=1 Tax=Pleurodeles waltl TaxID=8319 RepID=A0AAV7M390_PLEWA|nr:hypothetical protein NDU88_003382 [Pleurodeles waltl]